ncbi:MAG: tRNA (N6-isopentenyl adenosine(37)-C2)-methylthiotransferase MiaB [Reichenbachiella sp.]
MKELIEDLGILSEKDKLQEDVVHVTVDEGNTGKKKLYIESYGCQMNFSDSEIVSSIMKEDGYTTTSSIEDADVTFLNTCSIRDKAEQTVRQRLAQINNVKKRRPEMTIGVLGCMAERLKAQLLDEEKIVDLVVGPDAYRDLPNLLSEVESGQKAVNTFLSKEETYADISPVRLNSNGVTAFISIMRGCDNMCSFCVVPFTRGRERSRDPHSVVKEAQDLLDNGYKEVTLLGQNVDSYKWSAEQNNKARLEKSDVEDIITFAKLLEMVADVSPELRVRFSTSHPKDITDDVLYAMKSRDNICKYIHLPVQSGNSRVLEMMNRTYDRPWYLSKVDRIREILGDDCGVSSDMIAGFCTETEEEHQETLSIMKYVKYDMSYMFFYSERPGTLAEKKYEDDIPLDVKKKRLTEIIALQRELSLDRNQKDIGKIFKILVEGTSKKSQEQLFGRNTANKVAIFDAGDHKKGEYIQVKIHNCSAATLFGTVVES